MWVCDNVVKGEKSKGGGPKLWVEVSGVAYRSVSERLLS